MKKLLTTLLQQLREDPELTDDQEKKLFQIIETAEYKSTEMLYLLEEIKNTRQAMITAEAEYDSTEAEILFVYLGCMVGFAMALNWIDMERVDEIVEQLNTFKMKRTYGLAAFYLIASNVNPFWKLYSDATTLP